MAEKNLKEEIESLNKELEMEYARWEVSKLSTSLIPQSSESIWYAKIELQAMMNVLISHGFIDVDELNVEFKTIQLNDMKNMRKSHEESRREALTGKPKIGVPKIHVVGKDGKGGIEL